MSITDRVFDALGRLLRLSQTPDALRARAARKDRRARVLEAKAKHTSKPWWKESRERRAAARRAEAEALREQARRAEE